MNRFLVFALIFTPSTCHAITATYSDRSVFEARLSDAIFDDYQDPGYVFQQTTADMNAVLGETRYQPTTFTNVNLVFLSAGSNKVYCAGCNGSYLLDFTDTSIAGSNGVGGVGFNFFNELHDPSAVVRVTFGDNSIQFYPLPQVHHTNTLAHFFGITSDKQIATIQMLAEGGSAGHDNLTIGRIPEPSAIVLVVGLFLFGVCRRCAYL